MPIIKAAAVTAVRAGLRAAFSEASFPTPPATFVIGTESTPTTGRTMKRASIATATKIRIAPPASVRSRLVVSASLIRPKTIPAPPSTAITIASAGVSFWKRPTGSVAPSRSAAIGAILVARNAGKIEASTVIPTPTASATTTVCHDRISPVAGRPNPIAPNSLLSPQAKTIPSPMPMIEATEPMMNASPTTVPRICRREAPIVRSIANSRVRWATVIENVL